VTSSTPDPHIRPISRSRLYEQVAEKIVRWMTESDLQPGDRLPPERELAARLGVSRATISQALVAMEVVGVVSVRQGDGVIVTDAAAEAQLVDGIGANNQRMPDILDARDAIETKNAALAAARHTDVDLDRIEAALEAMAADIAAGGHGIEADEQFHDAVTQAAHSGLLAQMTSAIAGLIADPRLESLSRPGRPRAALRQHQAIAQAIRAGDSKTAARAMHRHLADSASTGHRGVE